MAVVYLGLGTNLGDRAANLTAALAAVSMWGDIEAISTVYETEPVGIHDQPDFWNLAVRLRTTIPPADLLLASKAAERRLGRVATVPGGPRVIDIDMLLYDDLVLHDAELELPHPRMMQRAFVLRPLVDLDAALTHPATGESLKDLLTAGTFERIRPILAADALVGDHAGGQR